MKILCFGDSNTYGYDPRGYFGGRYDSPWPELLAEKLCCTVINWGENGREIPEEAVAFPEDLDLLIIMLGTNDLLQARSAEAVCGSMEAFLEGITLARDKLLLIAPPPLKLGQWVQDQRLVDDSVILTKHYQALSERWGIPFADAGKWNVDLAYDGVHLTEKGHSAFAEGLFRYLSRGE